MRKKYIFLSLKDLSYFNTFFDNIVSNHNSNSFFVILHENDNNNMVGAKFAQHFCNSYHSGNAAGIAPCFGGIGQEKLFAVRHVFGYVKNRT